MNRLPNFLRWGLASVLNTAPSMRLIVAAIRSNYFGGFPS